MNYQVTWVIDIDADDPLEAARIALRMQRDHDSIANVFRVDGVEYDLAVKGEG